MQKPSQPSSATRCWIGATAALMAGRQRRRGLRGGCRRGGDRGLCAGAPVCGCAGPPGEGLADDCPAMPEPIRSFGLPWVGPGSPTWATRPFIRPSRGPSPKSSLCPCRSGRWASCEPPDGSDSCGAAALLLGGGTVVGRRIWRLHLHQALALSARVPPHMIGVGVEDPRFRPGRPPVRREKLSRWRPLLGRFERVTVRGPRSWALLTDAGVDPRVVGDPPPLLDPTEHPGSALPLPPTGPRPGSGVPHRSSDDLRGHDQEGVVAATAVAAAPLWAEGLAAPIPRRQPSRPTGCRAVRRLVGTSSRTVGGGRRCRSANSCGRSSPASSWWPNGWRAPGSSPPVQEFQP